MNKQFWEIYVEYLAFDYQDFVNEVTKENAINNNWVWKRPLLWSYWSEDKLLWVEKGMK